MHAYPPSPVDTFHTSIDVLDDAVDDLDAANIHLSAEGLHDNTSYLKNRIGTSRITNFLHGKTLTTSIAGQSTNNAFGTGDLALISGTMTIATLEIVKVKITFHASGSGAAQAEFRLAYKIGSGGTLHEIMRNYDGSIGTDVREKTICGSFSPADDAEVGGALYLYLQVRSPGGTNTSYIYEPWSYSAEGTVTN